MQFPYQSHSQEAAKTIIKNIFKFSQILNHATSLQVEHWTAASVHNAVHWALYCEEIYKHVHGQDCENSLNFQLKHMTQLLTPASCINLTITSLQNATSLLTETLLGNPHSTSFLQEALQRCLANSSRQDIGKQIKEKIDSSEASLQVLQDVISLFSSSKQKADVILWRARMKCCSEMLVRKLTAVLKSNSDDKRFQTYCHSVCDRIFNESTDWDIFIHCVSLDLNALSADEMNFRKVTDCILSWMVTKLKNSSEICSLWKINPEVLNQAFRNNSNEFVRFYLLALETWADSFQPTFNLVDCFEWRTPEHTAQDLIEHFKFIIFSQGSDQALYLLNFLKVKLEDSDFTIWHTVAQNILNSA